MIRIRIFALLGLACVSLLHSHSACGQAPSLINYQGRLLSGTNLVNSTVGLSLRLFNVPSGGSSIYEDSNSVTVVDGLYSTFIGDTPTNSSFLSALTNAAIYVEVAVNGSTLSPRERLASVGYSLATRGISVNAANNTFVHNPAENSVDPSAGWSTIGGGFGNSISSNSLNSTLVGGYGNSIHVGAAGFLGGGYGNIILPGAFYSFLGGGYGNTIGTNAFNSVIPGGESNTVGSGVSYAFAAGRRAKAMHDGTFVWADGQNVDFASTAANQFLVRASGGVGINMKNPLGFDLAVGGSAYISNSLGIGVISSAYELDVGNRIRLRQNGVDTAGLWLYQAGPAENRAFVGMVNDGYVGLYGSEGTGWGIVMNVTNGNIGIGTETPGYKLEVNGLAHRVDNSSTWTTTSDRRLKTGIEPMTNALALLGQIKPVNFHYTEAYLAANPGLPAATQYGVIAQEFQEAFPEFVKTNADGYLTVDSSPLTFVNTAAIQALEKENAEFRLANDKLKNELESLKARLVALEAKQREK